MTAGFIVSRSKHRSQGTIKPAVTDRRYNGSREMMSLGIERSYTSEARAARAEYPAAPAEVAYSQFQPNLETAPCTWAARWTADPAYTSFRPSLAILFVTQVISRARTALGEPAPFRLSKVFLFVRMCRNTC